MRLVIAASAAFAGLATCSSMLEARQNNFEEFVTDERIIALSGALANIGGLNSSLVPGAQPGIVVASPSTLNPNYFYTWSRDSALTYMMIVDELGFGNASLLKTVEDYIKAQAVLQTVTNPSGSLYPDGAGLGEPKFYTNLTRFNEDWGRPQRDGPALRATTLMELSFTLLKKNASLVQDIYWPIILNDLKYVGQYWNNTGYDLWEEVHGSSFFTINAQHRALVEGSMLAKALNTTCHPCEQASQILCFLQHNFWNATGGYLTADINVNNVNRSGINADPLLSSIQVFDSNAGCNASDFQPCNSQILATHKVYVDSFREIYSINGNRTPGNAILTGRYPEDSYYGGNPWPICTLAAAEVLYDAVAQFKKAGSITVDQYSLAFFQDLYPNATATTYSGAAFTNITTAMTTYADGFINEVQIYLPQNGSISEQYNRSTGESLSASKLTWSFAAFVTAARRREGKFPPSWGAMSALANTQLGAKQCKGTSYNSTFTYTPARAAGAPGVDKSCKTEVLFTTNATTMFGQNIFLVGNSTDLGGSVNNVSAIILPMNPGNYTSQRAEWFSDIWLPAGQLIEYQYVLQNGADPIWTFENLTRTVRAGPCGSGTVMMTNDAASFPPPPKSSSA